MFNLFSLSNLPPSVADPNFNKDSKTSSGNETKRGKANEI